MSQTTETQPEINEPVERAIAVVCDVFGVTRLSLKGVRRSGPEWNARRTAFALLSEFAGYPDGHIGKAFGRSRNGVRHCVASLAAETENDADLAAKVQTAKAIYRRWADGRGAAAA